VSHEVGALLTAGGWLHAAAQFSAELGAESGELEHFKTASALSAVARGHALAAWELSVKEGQARPKPMSPFMVAYQETQARVEAERLARLK